MAGVARQIDCMTSRMTQGCKTVEEVNGIIALYIFFCLFNPAHAVNYDQARYPKSGMEAENLVHDFLQKEYRDRRTKSWSCQG